MFFNNNLRDREVFEIEKDLEIRSIRLVFESYEIKTPEIESMLNGKVLKKEVFVSDEISKNKFLDKFNKSEDMTFSKGVVNQNFSQFESNQPVYGQEMNSSRMNNEVVNENPLSVHDVDFFIDNKQTNKVENGDGNNFPSFVNKNIDEIPEKEIKIPKTKFLSLNKNEKGSMNEDNAKKSSYFSSQYSSKKEESFI